MDALAPALIAGLALLAAYATYGRWVARRVFQLREDAPTPAVRAARTPLPSRPFGRIPDGGVPA